MDLISSLLDGESTYGDASRIGLSSATKSLAAPLQPGVDVAKWLSDEVLNALVLCELSSCQSKQYVCLFLATHNPYGHYIYSPYTAV